jgi:hypothetical protein
MFRSCQLAVLLAASTCCVFRASILIGHGHPIGVFFVILSWILWAVCLPRFLYVIAKGYCEAE